MMKSFCDFCDKEISGVNDVRSEDELKYSFQGHEVALSVKFAFTDSDVDICSDCFPCLLAQTYGLPPKKWKPAPLD